MPLQNDDSIPNDAILYRVLHPTWVTLENGKRRPTSNALLDSNREASLFIAGPGVLEELRRLFPGYEIASVRASIIRAAQLAIQRRPDECHEDFHGDRASHVVVGPGDDIGRNEYQRRTRAIAKNAEFTILQQAPPGDMGG